MTNMVETDDMPFGKHSGTMLKDVPMAYCRWLIKQDWLETDYPALKGYLDDRPAQEIVPLTDTSLMPFGGEKGHRDKPMADVPAQYLMWCVDQEFVKTDYPELYAYIEKNRELLEEDAAKEEAEHKAKKDKPAGLMERLSSKAPVVDDDDLPY